ncbi:MAG: N-formylglutamate amidohydrolase [Planctomycetales bacterium]|nr:N-formylglutamate amidohydrolase [Planctomycetales bacterium]
MHLILTCEHGGNQVPRSYRVCFTHAQPILVTHRGYDIGALSLARALALHFEAPLHSSKVTRLLIELNRSLHHRNLFSEFTVGLATETKQQIINTFYLPYRTQVEQAIRETGGPQRPVLHVSVHTFTPQLNEQVRVADVGLLYSPQRTREAVFCKRWQSAMREAVPNWTVRRNYPYRGSSDGFTTYLRTQFSPDLYLGLELEVNQKHAANARFWRSTVARGIAASLETALRIHS